MRVYVKEKIDYLQALAYSIHKGEEREIRQSLEFLLTVVALECDPGQVTTLVNFANSIKFDRELYSDRSEGRNLINFQLTNYNYQLD
ncbi:hypothetical protein Desor_1171 [Desulfosporosinus orientis DSM 765]|uniref:Uncharacterized protein n=1 Tax=Desulfosporosinus orientis (strain ATCC 19365 / DSM 765 / NCIMB 8382 / VKM B-1628 / Singapore I) TaxID=768706 RepID=G7WCT2_DESOD|nr:hypothetical protein [Desulfosporosinus orientis]AET66838.1 hypothetical protein Desor_1171 [Desulfosporosinus orientis DSM 765]